MDIERLGDLYFELSNEDRLGILHRLRDTPMNVTRLARSLNITTQECSRHMARLSEALLVARDPEGAYSLTPYGRLSLKLISGPSFVAEHRDYFNSHSLDVHPRELVARIGELEAGKTTGNAMVTFGIVENIMREAKEFLLMIHDQYLLSILPLCVSALKRGVNMRSVELKSRGDRRNLNPERPGYISEEDEDFFIKAWSEESSQARFTEDIDIFLYANEAEAVIAFPLSEGGFDYLGFSSDDPAFHKFCVDTFNHYWEQGEPPSRERVLRIYEARKAIHKGKKREK
jgi:predicted transcriptional regulator